MNKKILLDSMLVFTMLLLMPSIPAIQQNITKDEIENKIVSELSEDLDFKDIREILESGKLDRLKRPLLYLFIILISLPRIIRLEVLGELSYSGDWPFNITVKNKIFFLRYGMVLFFTALWFQMWDYVSIFFGWNWNI